jgi:hypothetical protein
MVEFGLIALLFVGLMFAVIDFGLLLNAWLAVSSGSREVARSASVGKDKDFLEQQTRNLKLPAVNFAIFPTPCCASTSAVELTVTYHNQCTAGPGCPPLASNQVLDIYPGGLCPSPGPCPHPIPGDSVRVVIAAHGAQVITPLIRPFFGCTDSVNPNCKVTLTSTTVARFEGQNF